MPAPDSAHRLQQLERDRRLRTCVRLGAAVHHERGTVALRDAEIAGLRRQLALAQGHPDPSPVGIAAHPRLEALRADRAEIRARVHFWLGLPERARLCLHPGDPEDDEAAERLLTAAMHLTRPRNDTVVVVISISIVADTV